MRHRKKTVTIDRKAGPRNALLRSLTISLIKNGKITTTPVKAKAVQQMIEPIITRGKVKSVHNIRQIESTLANKEAAMEVVDRVSPRFVNRAGGYTSIVKVGHRKGDGAEQVVLQFVD